MSNISKDQYGALAASFGRSVQNNLLQHTTVAAIFDRIQFDPQLADATAKVRQIEDSDQRREAKTRLLPYFNLGVFRGDERSNASLLETHFMVFDFDHANDLVSLRTNIIQDPRTFATFTSPSGDGLKVVFRLSKPVHENATYTATYLPLLSDLETLTGEKPDRATKDVARPTFFSSDPDIYVNWDAEPIIPVLPVLAKTLSVKEMREHAADLRFLPSAIEHLRTVRLDYSAWMQCGFALAALGETGREHFRTLSINDHHTDSIDSIDAKFDNCIATGNGSVTIASLFQIAKDHGYVYPSLTTVTPHHALAVSQVRDLATELSIQFALDDVRDPNSLLGFPLSKFKTLAKHTDGIQPGFYHLAAETNVGKTAVLTNLTLDVLETNPDVSVLYFSLDDNARYTVYRMLSVLTQFPINEVQRPRGKSDLQIVLGTARATMLDYIRCGRLVIKDIADIQHISQVESEILRSGDTSKLVVFIDGLYNIAVDGGNGGIREENIERATRIKAIVDTHHVPVISTGELRKKTSQDSQNKKPTVHDLMETGKFAYNANVVWLLYAERKEDLATPSPYLTLEFAKNKLSDFKGTMTLEFVRNTGTMRDVQGLFSNGSVQALLTTVTVPGVDGLFD